MDVIILLAAGKLRRKELSWNRILLSAATGSSIACIAALVNGIPLLIRILIFYIITGMLMARIAFGKTAWKEFKNNFFVLLLVTYLLGGVLHSILNYSMAGYYVKVWMNRINEENPGAFFVIGASLIFLPFLTSVLKKHRENEKSKRLIYPVRIRCRDFSYDALGFCDTGNSLCEPTSGKPVILADRKIFLGYNGNDGETKDWFKELICEMPQRYCVVPYASIGGTGILSGIRMEEVELLEKDGNHCYQEVVVALSNHILSQNNEYQLILHRELFEDAISK